MTLLALALTLPAAIGFARITMTRSENWNPTWVADYLSREHLLPGGARLLAGAFPRLDETSTEAAADAAAGDEVLRVQALDSVLPAGAVLQSGGIQARLKRAAAAGATQLAVYPLDDAIASGTTLSYSGNARRLVPAATLVGRTYDQRADGVGFQPADLDVHEELMLTVHDVQDVDKNADVALLRRGTLLRINFLPRWESRSEAEQKRIMDLYETMHGHA